MTHTSLPRSSSQIRHVLRWLDDARPRIDAQKTSPVSGGRRAGQRLPAAGRGVDCLRVDGRRAAGRRDLPHQHQRGVGHRLSGPGAGVDPPGLGSARHDLRAPALLSGQGEPEGVPAATRSSREPPRGLARRQDVHLQAPQRLQVQRRDSGAGKCIRARDQPPALTADELSRRAVRPRYRRRRAGGHR